MVAVTPLIWKLAEADSVWSLPEYASVVTVTMNPTPETRSEPSGHENRKPRVPDPGGVGVPNEVTNWLGAMVPFEPSAHLMGPVVGSMNARAAARSLPVGMDHVTPEVVKGIDTSTEEAGELRGMGVERVTPP
jgi:hypothetical protein